MPKQTTEHSPGCIGQGLCHAFFILRLAHLNLDELMIVEALVHGVEDRIGQPHVSNLNDGLEGMGQGTQVLALAGGQ